jgi:hypothetical protein
MPSDLCLLDHPYILTACPFDALPLGDVIPAEPLDDRTTYALLQGLLSALHYLFEHSIAGLALSSSNILAIDLSPENPRFWLTGVSSARPIPGSKIKESHATDVGIAMRVVADIHGRSSCFQDPVANAIFTDFLQSHQSGPLSAKEILHEFNTLTCGKADFPFKSKPLTANFSIKRFQLDGHAYYRKTELAQIASALFAQTVEGSQQACMKVLSTKSRKSLPDYEGEQLLHLEEMQTLFQRLGKTMGINFWPRPEPKKKKRGREEGGESIQDFCVQIRISYHAPSKMWNLSQLINATRPTDPLNISDLDSGVEVGGDVECEGLYVDPSIFESACRLLRVSPPAKFPESDDDGRAKRFRSAGGQRDDLVLADAKLLGTATFRRSSRTVSYGGTEYSETNALQLFTHAAFGGLHRAISQSRFLPQSLKILCQGQPVKVFPESQCRSLTESQSEGLFAFTKHRQARHKTDQEQHKESTENWVREQLKRRRHSRADIKRHAIVNGYLQPVNDRLESVSCSSSVPPP